MVGKPKRRTTGRCCLPYIIKRSALSVFAQIRMRMKITEHKKSIAVSPSNVKLPLGKRIRAFLYIPRRIIGCPIFPFEIYGISTALLHKNKCSTYKKYVSALFLFASCIYTVYFKRLTERLFSKTLVLQNRHGCSFVGGFAGILLKHLMRLACASEVFFSPKADDRFEAVDTETLFEYRSLFCAALPLLIGIIVIGF